MNKEHICCFTGHRIIPGADLPRLTQRLDKTIAKLVSRGIIYFGSGAALGFDTLAAQAVLGCREHNAAVKLILVLPCRNQDAYWQEAEKKEYRRLISAADKVVCLSESYYSGCYKTRNLHLVKHSGVCVAYLKQECSGSWQTVCLARRYGLHIINLAD